MLKQEEVKQREWIIFLSAVRQRSITDEGYGREGGERYVSIPIYRRKMELLEAELGDELVGLNPDAGLCFGFNDVAAAAWRRLKEPATLEQLCEALRSEYEVSAEQCAAEVAELLQDLLAKGLVTVKN